jgi:Porin subfamily
MTRKPYRSSVGAIGGLGAAIVLLTALPSARGDELADLRANQELLQKRIDQLAQAPQGVPSGQAPAASGPGLPVVGGSFPRSFLIPGTDTSLRIGGQAYGTVLRFWQGAQPSTALFGNGGAFLDRTSGTGGTGNLQSIPLNNSIAHSRSSQTFFSGNFSRVFIDVRTPSAWGEAKAYIEWDWSQTPTNQLGTSFTVTSNFTNRFRKGYATLGGLLVGQDSGTMVDNDSEAELIDTGGDTAANGRSRIPQVRYTYAGPYGTSLALAIEQSLSEFASPVGTFNDGGSNDAPATAACPTGNLAVPNLLTTACLTNSTAFNAAKTNWPNGVIRGRFEQPWGHIQTGFVLNQTGLNDGRYLDRQWLGYGGAITGDVKPFTGAPPPFGLPGAWAKDDIAFGAIVGEGLGGFNPSTQAVATNWGGTLGGLNPTTVNGFASGPFGVAGCSFTSTNAPCNAPRQKYDSLVSGSTISAIGAHVALQHWWTPELRSNFSFAWTHQDIPAVAAAGAGQLNKELMISHINIFWTPVNFVDLALEGGWGRRQTVNNFKGDMWTTEGMLRVRF